MSEPAISQNWVSERIRILRPELEKRGVAHIDLFGSVARGDAKASSDVDLMIEMSRPLGFDFFLLEKFLTNALGVDVELSTRGGLRPRVLASAERDIVRIF